MTSSAISEPMFLAINSAEERLQIVLGNDENLLFSAEIHCPGQSVTLLPGTVKRGLRVCRITARDLQGISVVQGPGSFTGLRIAHAFSQALARAFCIPMAGISYHQALATQLLWAESLWVITYARRGMVYAQKFCAGQPNTDLAVFSVPDLLPILQKESRTTALMGSGIRKNPALQEETKLIFLPPLYDTLFPQTLFSCALSASYRPAPVMPLYLRKSDAEDNLPAIAKARGISLAQAKAHLFPYTEIFLEHKKNS